MLIIFILLLVMSCNVSPMCVWPQREQSKESSSGQGRRNAYSKDQAQTIRHKRGQTLEREEKPEKKKTVEDIFSQIDQFPGSHQTDPIEEQDGR